MDNYNSFEDYHSYDEYNPQESNPFFADFIKYIIDKYNVVVDYIKKFYCPYNNYKLDEIKKAEKKKSINNIENKNINLINDIINDDSKLGCTLIFNESNNITKSQSENILKLNYKNNSEVNNSDGEKYELLEFSNKDKEIYMKELKRSTSESYFFF